MGDPLILVAFRPMSFSHAICLRTINRSRVNWFMISFFEIHTLGM